MFPKCLNHAKLTLFYENKEDPHIPRNDSTIANNTEVKQHATKSALVTKVTSYECVKKSTALWKLLKHYILLPPFQQDIEHNTACKLLNYATSDRVFVGSISLRLLERIRLSQVIHFNTLPNSRCMHMQVKIHCSPRHDDISWYNMLLLYAG